MSFLRYLQPNQSPKNVTRLGELFVLRERIFQSILLFGTAMALVGFSVVVPLSLRRGNTSSLVIISLILGLFLILGLGRAIPYKLRAFSLLAALFAVGAYTFAFSGLAGNGKLILIAVPILAGILLGLQAGIIGLVVSTITFIGFGYAMTSGLILAPDPYQYASSSISNHWTSGIVYFVLLGGMATISLVAFIRNLQSSLNLQRDLTEEVEKERQNLELSVIQRTQDLANRLNQIRSAAEISRSISSVLNLDELLQQVVELVQARFNLYYVGVFLIDKTGKYAILKAGTGTAGKEMLSRQHQLLVAGASMIGWATANQKSRIALDTGAEAVRFNNPYLPDTRSEMALPILSRGVTLGALTVQSDKPNAFDNDDITILSGIADSLAVAIENADLFSTTRQNLEEIRLLNQQYLQQAWNETIGMKGSLDYTYQSSPKLENNSDISQVSIPLTIRDQIIGEITLELGRDYLTDQDQAIVEAISSQTAQALENARLLEDVERKALQEERINNLSAEFSQSSSIEEILRSAVFSLGQIPNVAEVSLHIMPPEDQATTTSPTTVGKSNGNGHHPQEGSK
jgi:GAF domain-containing protein